VLLEGEGEWDCSKDGNITINQEILTSQVVECYSHVLQQSLMKNQNISDAVSRAEQANKSKNTGISEAIATAMGPFAMIWIVVIIAIVVAIPLLLFAFKSRGGKVNIPTINVPNPLEKAVSQALRQASRRY
jgi:nitric oxide reductase large subunit